MNDRTLMLGAVLALFAVSAAAQPKPGDLVLVSSSPGAIHYLDWQTQRLATLTSGFESYAIQTRHDNAGLLACTRSLADAYMLSIDPRGVTTTVSSLGTRNAQGFALDQTGDYIIASRGHLLLRVTRNGVLSTFATLPTTLSETAMCRDGLTGDFIVTAGAPSTFLRVDGATGAARTISNGLGRGYAIQIDWIPSTGNIVSSHVSGGIYVIDGAGTIVTSLNWNGRGVTIDERRDRVFFTSGSIVVEMTPAGVVTKTLSIPGAKFRELEIWADQNVTVRAPTAKPGSVVDLDLAFPASPRASYCAALSFSSRGGFTIAGQRINLRPDALFSLTVCGLPPLTTGFSGTTDANGDAPGTVSFLIPLGVPRGTKFYASAVAVNPAFPSGLDVGNVQLVVVR